MRAGCRGPGRLRRTASAPRSTGSRLWPRGPERYGSSWVRDTADAWANPRVPDWDSGWDSEPEPTPARRTGSSRIPAGRPGRFWHRPVSSCRRGCSAGRRCAARRSSCRCPRRWRRGPERTRGHRAAAGRRGPWPGRAAPAGRRWFPGPGHPGRRRGHRPSGPEIPWRPARIIRTINADNRVREWRLNRITTERAGFGRHRDAARSPAGSRCGRIRSSHPGTFGPGRVPEGLFARSLRWLTTGLRAAAAGS